MLDIVVKILRLGSTRFSCKFRSIELSIRLLLLQISMFLLPAPIERLQVKPLSDCQSAFSHLCSTGAGLVDGFASS